MSYTLRPYQQEAVDIGVDYLKNYGKPFIIQAATGAGKSLIIADICTSLNEPVLILQPSKELLEQNFEKLQSYNEINSNDIAIYSASKNRKEIGQYTYATIGSIYKKPEEFRHFKYVIIDECHQVNPKNLGGMYATFLNAIGCKNVCGLTATPYRIQQKFFRENGELFYTAHLKMINRIYPFFFKEIAYKIETADLIEQGYLAPIKYQIFDANWKELVVNSTGADFTKESMEKYWNDSRLEKLATVIGMIDKHCKRNLIFCSSLRQAENARRLLEHKGILAYVVSAETPKKARESLVRDYRAGVFKHLINVGVFTTGFDVPELNSIVLARPTRSLALYYQMVGRGVRIDHDNEDKALRVFDFAGCVEKMGRVETIRLGKEDGFKDTVESEVGRMDERPLFTFEVKNKKYSSFVPRQGKLL